MTPPERATGAKKPHSTSTKVKRSGKKTASPSARSGAQSEPSPTRKPQRAKASAKHASLARGARSRGPASETARTFRLTVQPAKADTFGVNLSEAEGTTDGPSTPVVTATAAQTGRVLDAVLTAVKGSGHQAGRLAVKRDQPIPLDEAEGVRLAVILLATQPINVNERIRRIVAGVNFMSIEETYYWYAKCVGPNQAQARKAIRILLADPKRQDQL